MKRKRERSEIRSRFSVSGGFALAAANPVDMPFKVSAADQLRQYILLISGDSAAVKADTEFKDREQGSGEYHVSHTERRRYSAGEGVQIDDILAGGACKKRLLRLAKQGKL